MPKLNVTPPPTTTTPIVDTPAADVAVAGNKKKAPVTTVDSIKAPAIDTTALNGPTAVSKASLGSIPEAFPIDALSKIDGKGVSGTTFMLDGGSLRGLKLQVRRVVDGEQPGFELTFQLTEDKLKGMMERMNTKEAKSGSVAFRGVALNDQGVSKYTDQVATVSGSGTHSPPDLDSNASSWQLAVDDAKGAKISVVHDKAALAIRGLVRIDLRGDDPKCTEQLKSVVKSLGLQHLFAPPTPKSKQINMLMRVLWQADHAAAKAIAAEDLDKVKVSDLEKALESVGYTPERIAGLSYQEVFPRHFTVVDPMQDKAMVDAGARYLYSTVTEPAHVHSILTNGQKSSVQRYKDGLIINGMSTNADFITGGGSGVFTRLVTQNAIYGEGSWAGRTYKMLQNHSQLGRTDFHGWDGDFYGRRWNLETETNFGVDLVKKIDQGGGYKDYNELIFTAGNRPENIDRVIATSESDRKTLIDHLKAQSYTPHNGLSLEEFVVMSPKFLIFGPSPYADTKDIPAFAAEALKDATGGNLAKLQWLLFEGPIGKPRAELEEKLFADGPKAAQDVLLKAVKRTGKFSMTAKQLDGVITKLSAAEATPEQKAMLTRLPTEAAEALFRSGSDKAVDILVANKPASNGYSYYSPYGISDESFVRIYEELASKQKPGQPRSKAFELALDVRAESLLTSGHAGFKAFLEKNPLVKPADPKAWLAEKMLTVKADGAGKAEVAMYLAQLTDKAVVGAAQKQLLEADAPATLELLKSSIAMHGQIHLTGDALSKALSALPETSATRQHLLSSAPGALLKTADPTLLAMLQKQFPSNGYNASMGIYGEEWGKIIEAQLAVTGGKVTDVVKTSIELGGSNLLQLESFKKMLPTLNGLYDMAGDPKAFAETATKEMNAPGTGYAKLGWMMLGPNASELRLPALQAILASNDYQAQYVLSYVQNPPGKFPASPEELRGLVKELSSDAATQPALTKLLGAAGKDVLLSADAATLELLAAYTKGKPNPMSLFGLYGDSITALINELESKPATRAFLLKEGAGDLIAGNDESFIANLIAKKTPYAELGQDAAWAASMVKQTCDNQQYYWTNDYYLKYYPDYGKMPEGAKYLLKGGTDKYDEPLLAEMEKSIKSWAWSKPMFDQFMKLTTDMPDEWKTKLTAAHGAA